MTSNASTGHLDMFVRETGLKKGRVIEDALNYHLDALRELPADAIIPTRVVISRDDGVRFIDDLTSDADAPDALRRLMSGA